MVQFEHASITQEPPLVYLDHASTTPMRPRAVAAMSPYLEGDFGNPSGLHSVSRRARRALDEAREELALVLGSEPGEVVFTSGGTESDNLAVGGVHARRGGVVLCSAIEHPAVLAATEATGGRVFAARPDGTADPEALDRLLSELDPGSVALVSVMLVNNELGTIQSLAEIAAVLAWRAPQALLHTDAVAAVGWLDVAELAAPADLVSVSGHKFGAGRGAGALVVRRRARPFVEPILRGGGQEGDLRPGTQNVPAIVAMAASATMAEVERASESPRVASLRDRLAAGIRQRVAGARETVGGSARVAGICHLTFPGIEAEELLLLLDQRGVAASAGSACASGALEPSHVLSALGMTPEESRSCVRFSLGHVTTEEEIGIAIGAVVESVERLRS